MKPDKTTVSDSPSPPPAPDPERPSLKNFLETAGKLLLGIAGLCYVTGLMVVTIHLGRYGLNSLILSQLHYVMAGIWALLPIVLAMFLTIAAMNSAFQEIERIKRRPKTTGTEEQKTKKQQHQTTQTQPQTTNTRRAKNLKNPSLPGSWPERGSGSER